MKEGDVVLTPLPQADGRPKNRPASVQMPVAEFRTLVVATYGVGFLSEGEAASLLGVSRPEFFELARAEGVSTCSYSESTIDAELSRL